MGTYSYTGTIQKVTVGATGTYDIAAYGAQGGSGFFGGSGGGQGAEVLGQFNLTAGEKLEIVVGGAGASATNRYSGGGGGGGSFVLANTGAGGAYVPLEVAGGGGGGYVRSSGGAGSTTTPGNGQGGAGPYGGGGGGAGVKSSGTFGGLDGGNGGSNGSGNYAGGTGGSFPGAAAAYHGANGGFGGGGGSNASLYAGGKTIPGGGGGGGGGYSGGNGGGGTESPGTPGFGGTSFVSSTGTEITAISGENGGSGKIVIGPEPVQNVSSEAGLNSALGTMNGATGSYTINVTGSFSLSGAITSVQLGVGGSLTINGGGFTIDGQQKYGGFVVTAPSATPGTNTIAINNLALNNMVETGGAGGVAGGAGGGGAGLGGGLFVGAGASVTLTNVSFNGDKAVGGAGGNYGGQTGGFGGGGSLDNASIAGDQGGAVSSSFPYLGGSGGFGGGGAGGYQGAGSSAFGGGAGVETRAATVQGGFGGGAAYSGNNKVSGGGGGLGAGGAIFVQSGGSLTIAGGDPTSGATIANGSVVGGAGGAGRAADTFMGVPASPPGGAGAALGSGIFLQGNQSITLAPAAGETETISDVIADQPGSAGLIVAGPGVVELSGANTYAGGTYLEGGTVDAGNVSAFGTGTIHAIDPTIEYSTSGTYSNPIELDVGAPASADPTIFQVDSGISATITGAITTGSGTNAMGQTIDANQPIVVSGPGTLTLGAANTYSGGTTINGGTLVANHVNANFIVDALGSGPVTLNGGTLAFDVPANTQNPGNPDFFTNALTVAGNGGTLDGGSTLGSGASAIDVTQGISGTGPLTFTDGTFELDGNNSGFSGATTITATGSTPAAVLANGPNTLSSSSAYTITGANAALAIVAPSTGTTSETIGSLAGTGTVTAYGPAGAAVSLSTGADNTSTTFSGLIEDSVSASGSSATLSIDKVGTGTFTLSGANTYSGGTTISGGTLDLASADTLTNDTVTSGAAGTGAITFAGTGTNPATLAVDMGAQPASGGTFGNTLASFGASDNLDLNGLQYTSDAPVFTAGAQDTGTLSVTEGSTTETFSLSDVAPGTMYYAHTDNAGGTLINTSSTACYCTGTLIRTAAGDKPVEALRVGDLVETPSGEMRPIRWIGHRAYSARFVRNNPELLPICFKAGSIADGMPARDLWVSPKHAMFIDGVLIPAEHLVNGASIVKAERVESLAYWHVELDSHDVLLAEGAPSESFVDDDSRGVFHNAHTFAAMYPDAPHLEAVYCAPRVEDGYILDGVRRRLAERAGLPLAPAPAFGLLRGYIDRFDAHAVAGWAQDQNFPDGPVCLDIVIDDGLVARVLAQRYRADLLRAGIGDGRHAFALELPAPLARDVPHVVEVRRSADGVAIAGTKRIEAAAAKPLVA